MVSLAAVWESFGVTPDAVVGHSQGEIAAATVAGGLSLRDAARVVALRSKLVARLSGQGGMMSLAVPEPQARLLIEPWPGLGIAAINGPHSVTLSGDPDALTELQATCETKGIWAARIPVDYAAHSPQIDTLHTELTDALADVQPQPATVPMWSTVTSTPIDTLDAAYWFRNLRHPVHFASTIAALANTGHSRYIEISAHPVLVPAIQDTLDHATTHGTLRRNHNGADQMITALTQAWTHGTTINWTPQNPPSNTTATGRPSLPPAAVRCRLCSRRCGNRWEPAVPPPKCRCAG
jgi:acyl transferase domain-containing protein